MSGEQTINPLPAANSDFLETLQAFLQNEDGDRFYIIWPGGGFVVRGGIHGPVAGLTGVPSSLVAFPFGRYITETGAITYPDATTTWVVADAGTTGDNGGYLRVPGTHYLIASGGGPAPALPAGLIRLMQVTTAGGAITAVVDQRLLSPVSIVTDSPYIRLAGQEATGVDYKIREDSGSIDIQKNVGVSFDDPEWADRWSFIPSNFPLRLEAGNTQERTLIFPDKDDTLATLSDIGSSAFAPGTRMLFDNDAAPTGWTRVVTLDDYLPRIVSGARSDGGSWTVSGLTAASHVLTTAEIPSHSHAAPGGNLFALKNIGAGAFIDAGAFGDTAADTDTTGGGGGHTHSVTSDATWRPLHRDVILCEKD